MPGTPPGSPGTWGKPAQDERGEVRPRPLNLCAWVQEARQGPRQRPSPLGARAGGEQRLSQQGEHANLLLGRDGETMPDDDDDDAAMR